MPNFAEKVEIAVDALSCNPQREVDENEFIDASRLVYDGVVDIRQAVLMDRVGIKIKLNILDIGSLVWNIFVSFSKNDKFGDHDSYQILSMHLHLYTV